MPLTVVMYHYVRSLAGSRYPGLKGLELAEFVDQVSYLCRYYRPVSLQDVIDAVMHEGTLPANAILLTFDDGYAEHYLHVFPILFDRHVPAVFFPVAGAVLERRMLDVHKLHFILACEPATDRLVAAIEAAIERARGAFELLALPEYRQAYWCASRFDPPPIIYIKRLLQHALPVALRRQIADDLFQRYVSADERSFADDLYLSLEQARVMTESGMDLGGHGYEHPWMDRLAPLEQAHEIDRSLDFLRQTGTSLGRFSYAYPYGAYNQDTVRLLAERGCSVAFTTRVGAAEACRPNALVLPRLPTNDLPSDQYTWKSS